MNLSQAPTEPLDYAAPAAVSGRFAWFRAVTMAMALLCALFNVSLVVITVANLQTAAGVYPNLVRNPKSYGRVISPAVIESLRDTTRVQIAEAALIAAAALGLLLALYLMIAALKLHREAGGSARNLECYQRWKVISAFFTAAALGWSVQEGQQFWIKATRHSSVGSWPPMFQAAVLFACAMIPIWWVHRGVRKLTLDGR